QKAQKMTSQMSEKASNKILSAVPTSTSSDWNSLERVTLRPGMVLQEPDQEIEYVYFIEDGLVSLLSVNSDGGTIEIGVVGSEGMVGIPVILGGFSPYRAVVQIEGQAWRMRRKQIAEEFHRNPGLQNILLRYTNSFLVQL